MHLYRVIFVPSQNSYAETLISNGVVFESGVWEIIRVRLGHEGEAL